MGGAPCTATFTMIRPNQQDVIKKRQRTNAILTVVFLLLLAWLGVEVYHEAQRLKVNHTPLKAQHIQLVRDVNTVRLDKQAGAWQMTTPYQQTASAAVIQALLGRLQNGCRLLNDAPNRPLQFYAKIMVDNSVYQVGELNTASDEVYIQKGSQLFLCDKLLAAMALAPAINFMDKQLYQGELLAIAGDFGRLTDLSGIDLSVMEIAPADAKALPEHAVSTLQFVASDRRNYQAFLSEDSAHLLLFEPQQSVIYVIAANPKLNAILGL